MSEPIHPQITPMIIAFNEAANIGRCLERLTWARRVLVVDSGSDDGTCEIARAFPNVEIVTRPFDDFASQCNFGLSRIDTPWALSLDSDYILSEALVAEILTLRAGAADAYTAAFVYCIHGRPLRASLYPPRAVLYRRTRACYHAEGHGHRVTIDGVIARLAGRIEHDDRKPLSRWFSSQQSYARKEADFLLSAPPQSLGRMDRLRLSGWLAPALVLPYTLVWKQCLLDGWPGWAYAMQRTIAEFMIALELVDRRLARAGLRKDAGP